MNAVAEFAADPLSIGAARRFVAGQLGDADADAVDTVMLMVSELATNCVRHAGTPYRVSVSRTSAEVRVDVTDTGAGRARLCNPVPSDPHGRGLYIVSALADRWGTREDVSGKTTWFSYLLPAASADSEALAASRPASAPPELPTTASG